MTSLSMKSRSVVLSQIRRFLDFEVWIVDKIELPFFFVPDFIRVNLRGASLGARNEPGITWTDHVSGRGTGQIKRRTIFPKICNQSWGIRGSSPCDDELSH